MPRDGYEFGDDVGLLLVLEGDEQANGPHVNLTRAAHSQLLDAARRFERPCPLIRRMNEYYGNAWWEADEIAALREELMQVDHEELIERLRDEGVQKGRAEAERIVADAESRARWLVSQA